MRVGVATSEPEIAADGGLQFWQRVRELGLREVRLVAYRDNPALLDRLRLTVPLRPAGVLVSVVLIDSPGQPLSGFPEWAAVVSRALPDVYRLIVWNEPNAHAFWPHPPHRGRETDAQLVQRAGTYARLLNDTTAAIHRARPGVLVSAFGLAPAHRPVRFLQAALEAGARVGSLSVHLYPGSPSDGVRGSLALLRRLEALVRGRVYVDEFGWRVAPTCPEARQAALYRDFLRSLGTDRRVKSALVYRLEDGEGWTAGPHRPDGSRRPCWRVLRDAATLASAG